MSTLVIPVAIAVYLAAAVLHLMKKRSIGCWLLVPFPVLMCIGIVVDLSRGPVQLGEGAYVSDQKQLICGLVLLGVSLIAALRPKWPWLFWIAWICNALVVGVLVYLAYFWKVFS